MRAQACAEIHGRAVVRFDGPIAFRIVSRDHGAALVVRSGRLDEPLWVIAVASARAR